MNEFNLLIQNRLQDISILLERASYVQCKKDWMGTDILPPFSSIGYIVDGEGIMQVNGSSMYPGKGQMYLLPANTRQTFRTSEDHCYEKYFCHFHAISHHNSIFDFMQLPLCVNAKNPEAVIAVFQKMIACRNDNSPASFFLVKSCLLELIAYYLESCGEENVLPADAESSTPVMKAVHFMQRHLCEDINVEKVAAYAGYHPTYFSKVFHEILGITPVQFLTRLRLDAALRLLTETSLSITEAAELSGFKNQFYFCTFFKKHTGFSPTEYRRLYGSPAAKR